MRRLLHRWFVEYNPLYLVSAALVLIGNLLITRGLAQAGSLYGQLGVAAVAELYAWTLIGGAGLLMRLGLRRPAVMLALLSALYQCDVTLHTETSAQLGTIGALAAAAWLASFAAKLSALAWALRLRLSRSAVAVAMLGAFGLVVLPWSFSELGPAAVTPLVAAWLFSLLSSGLWTTRVIESRVPLDAWQSTVLRRALTTTWSLWAALACFHVLLWSSERGSSLSERGLDFGVVLPMAALLSTRWMRREPSIWLTVSATLLLVAIAMPSLLSLGAVMAAVVLCLRALRQPTYALAASEPTANAPYRVSGAEIPVAPAVPVVSFVLGSRAAMLRLFTGSLLSGYLSLWTIGWRGGAWPEHVLALDLLLSAAVVLLAWRARTRLALVPLAAVYFQLAVQTELITAPESKLEWGLASVALGFVLLLGSLLASWRSLRARSSRRTAG